MFLKLFRHGIKEESGMKFEVLILKKKKQDYMNVYVVMRVIKLDTVISFGDQLKTVVFKLKMKALESLK